MFQKPVSASLALMAALCVFGSSAAWAADWTQSGNDIRNSRSQPAEKTLGPGNVGNLQVKWVVETGGDVSSTPAVEGQAVYFGDWGGNIFRVNAKDGSIRWSYPLSNYTGFPGDWTRHTPTVIDNLLIIGNQIGRFFQGGAKLVAINKHTGASVWTTQLDPNPASIVTASPTIYKDVAYVGVASFEEGFAAILGGAYPWLLPELAGRPIIAHGAPIEGAYLAALLRRMGGVPMPNQFIDTLGLERRLLEGAGGRVRELHGDLTLDACRARRGLPDHQQHSAGADSIAAAELFLAQVAELGGAQQVKLRELR